MKIGSYILRCQQQSSLGETCGFTLVEVLLSLTIVSFVLVVISTLLPIGLKSNATSIEESRAADVLTTLEADLKNSLPSGSTLTATSAIYGLQTPYLSATTAEGRQFTTPSPNQIYTMGLDENDRTVPIAAGVRYQVSVIYTGTIASGSLQPMQARIIVNWPCLSTTLSTEANLTDPAKVHGYIESYVTFPAP